MPVQIPFMAIGPSPIAGFVLLFELIRSVVSDGLMDTF